MTLVLSPDPLGASIAGPAIRATELARAVGGTVEFSHPHDPGDVRARAAEARVVVAHPPWPLAARQLRRSGARLIYDLYDPEPLEALQFLAGRRANVRRTVTAMSLDRMVNALHDGHAFLCASERQRDLWTGSLLAQRLITPAIHDADPSLGGLLAVVPFGVPDVPPAPGPGPRERFGFAPDAEVVLWNGGLWDWLDAESVLRAVARLSPERPRLRLVFMGASAAAQARDAEARAKDLALDLGLLGRVANFNDSWVPYDERGAWLLQADCGVSAHRDHLETRYSHRTRLLDCMWAGLPVVCTRGDELAERIERDDLGATVPPADPDALAAGLARVLDRGREHYAGALAAAAADLRWSRVAEPLARLAEAPGASTPLGLRAGRGRPRSPALRTRDRAYILARTALNAAGRRDWPRVR
ncbi:MAG TPA: glycosyltransferase [Solirubrobacteraceae bacterium]|nr:glycosyltransferase [Solirubrobacteraceae bacterium]